jgi:hypothetical protein
LCRILTDREIFDSAKQKPADREILFLSSRSHREILFSEKVRCASLSMDTESRHESQLAEILCNAWSEFASEVTCYGDLVDFRMAWAHPTSSPHGLWSEAAKRLIAAVFPDHALLTMKAFPLEYEGSTPAFPLKYEGSTPRDTPSSTGLLLRQRAMIRYYEKQFGVHQFPGKSGEQGWLYKINPVFTNYIISPIDGAN